MKTVKQWLKTLPTEQRKLALNNLNDKLIANHKVNKCSDAIMIGFNWRDSVEGWNYWDNAWEALLLLGL